MKQHKWHKEIKAWADGAEIEYRNIKENYDWVKANDPVWDIYGHWEYRIKPQLKEPQYLYVCFNDSNEFEFSTEYDDFGIDNDFVTYIGKIKLEVDDE